MILFKNSHLSQPLVQGRIDSVEEDMKLTTIVLSPMMCNTVVVSPIIYLFGLKKPIMLVQLNIRMYRSKPDKKVY